MNEQVPDGKITLRLLDASHQEVSFDGYTPVCITASEAMNGCSVTFGTCVRLEREVLAEFIGIEFRGAKLASIMLSRPIIISNGVTPAIGNVEQVTQLLDRQLPMFYYLQNVGAGFVGKSIDTTESPPKMTCVGNGTGR